MKKLLFTLVILAGFTMQAQQLDPLVAEGKQNSCYIDKHLVDTIGTTFLDEESALYYTIISTDPPQVSVYGHVDGENAQGELDIPNGLTYEGVRYTVT